MRSPTRKPHFVPAAYLQFWDTSGKPKGRDSQVWWCDGKKSALQRVGKIAVQSNFYSAKNPNAAETHFGWLESEWAKLVKQLAAGRPPRAPILASLLLLHSTYFLLRNPKFRKNDPADRFDVYMLAIEGFWRQVLMAGHVPEQMKDAANQLLKTWNCHLLRAQTETWITSDNPVLLFSFGNATPAIIFLPITPDWALIALRTNSAVLSSSKISEQDTEYLNSYTAINSIRHVYSNRRFDASETSSLAKWYARRPPTDNWISSSQIHVHPFTYPVHGMRLGFL